MITIYHNGRCSKSRGALEILQEENIPHQVRWYLVEPLSEKELSALLKKLRLPASGLLRRSEPYFKKNLAGKELSEEACLAALVAHPELIERPIVVNGRKAVIARPPERLHEVL
ncbi:MAG: arsenate reductase (glutaredoxin) [Bacteroidetes bacterium]|nr:arsenate reductase (glutaredoxin) [Bacteroidota bacterium]MBS1630130.1 arsenate reductase (glutaredoxin) [Bacteroidota bacterium]